MMRCWLLRSLLLLSVLLHESRGIRLIRNGTPTDDQYIDHETLQGRSNDGIGEAVLCIGNHCSGRVRKLSENTISSTTTATYKNQNNKEKKSAKEENLDVDSSSEQHQPAAAADSYPGVLDIAGMDYSQARRKPPIHN